MNTVAMTQMTPEPKPIRTGSEYIESLRGRGDLRKGA